MLRPLFLFILLVPFAFPVVGEQCPEFQEACLQNACEKAHGELNEYGMCIQNEEFEPDVYEEEVAACNYAFDYCIENDGVFRNMSCCGPVFVLLLVFLFVARNSTAS